MEALSANGKMEGPEGLVAVFLDRADPLESQAGDALAQRLPQVNLLGDLGLDIVGEVVGVVAGEDLAARHGGVGASGPHLLDVAVVARSDDGRDVKVGQAVPAAKLDLTEHAGDVGLASGDSVVVADPGVGELDGLVLGAVDNDRVKGSRLGVAGEVDGTLNVVEGPEGDGGGAGDSGRGNKGHDGGSEMHFEGWFVDKTLLESVEVKKDRSSRTELRESKESR